MDILFFAKNLSVWDGYVYRYTGSINDGQDKAEQIIIQRLTDIIGNNNFVNRIVEFKKKYYIYLKNPLPEGIALFYLVGDVHQALSDLSAQQEQQQQQIAEEPPAEEPPAEEPPAEEPPAEEPPAEENTGGS